MLRVVIPCPEDVVPFDLAVPCEVFGRAALASGLPAYEVVVCGEGPVSSGLFTINPAAGLDALRSAHTVVVPGVSRLDRPPSPALLAALRDAAARGARVASICSGAFLLAAAGLLAGRRATTHWIAAAELAARHPDVEVDPAVLYVDDGQVLTSAGAAAGFDLCLHLVRRDHGAAVAARAARLSVMPLERAGGQAQFIEHPAPTADSGSLGPLLLWIAEHLDADLSVPALARRAAMSPRSLARRFREQVGMTPAAWVARARVSAAQRLLETSDQPVEAVGAAVGFRAASAFRERFLEVAGTTATAWRRAFRGAGAQDVATL